MKEQTVLDSIDLNSQPADQQLNSGMDQASQPATYCTLRSTELLLTNVKHKYHSTFKLT